MGLDMYLMKHKITDYSIAEMLLLDSCCYIKNNKISFQYNKLYCHPDYSKEQMRAMFNKCLEMGAIYFDKENQICSPIYEVAYWRKFNALHYFIITNFGDGCDDQTEIPLEKYDIECILKAIKNSISCYKKTLRSIKEAGKTDSEIRLISELWENVVKQYKQENRLFLNDEEENIGTQFYAIFDHLFETNKKTNKDYLKPIDGFFFGSIHYDNYYISCCEEAEKTFSNLLQNFDFDNESLFYSCSW